MSKIVVVAARPVQMRRGPRLGILAMNLFVLVLVVLIAVPYLWLVQMSLKTQLASFQMPPQLIFRPTLENYGAILQDTTFLRSFGNSTIAAAASMLVSLLVGVPAAYALSRSGARADGPISLWVLTTRMAPAITYGLPFFMAFRFLHLIDTLTGLVVIYLTFNLSLVIWMMRIFFDGLPRSLEEAAFIDGAGLGWAFLRITLPLSAPALATTAIFCFLFSWNDFFYALIVTRSQAQTAPVAIVNFMNYQGWDWGKITAGGTMIMLPVVVLAILVRRYMIRGLTAGSLKG